MTIEIQAHTRTQTPQFVSLDDLKAATLEAFLLGRKYKPYNGVIKPAYDAGGRYQWYGETRGNIIESVYTDSLVKAVEEGYKDGSERGLPSPRLDFVPELTDPKRSTVLALMEFITDVYVKGFEIGKASYKAAGIDTRAESGGMMATDGNWGMWFVGTVAMAAAVAVSAVLVRNSRKD